MDIKALQLRFTIPAVAASKASGDMLSAAETMHRLMPPVDRSLFHAAVEAQRQFDLIERIRSNTAFGISSQPLEMFQQTSSIANQAAEMIRAIRQQEASARMQVSSFAEEIARAARIPDELLRPLLSAQSPLADLTAASAYLRDVQNLWASFPNYSWTSGIASQLDIFFKRQIAERHRRVVEVLAKRGWVGLERYLSESHFERILVLNNARKLKAIDQYVCARFAQGSHRKLAGFSRKWAKPLYMNANKKAFREALGAHKAGWYASAIAVLLPLVDGLAAATAEKILGPSKKAIRVTEVAAQYNVTEDTIWSECVQRVICDFYQHVDFKDLRRRTKLNRHAILHGRTRNHASESNSLRVILMMDTIVEIALSPCSASQGCSTTSR